MGVTNPRTVSGWYSRAIPGAKPVVFGYWYAQAGVTYPRAGVTYLRTGVTYPRTVFRDARGMREEEYLEEEYIYYSNYVQTGVTSAKSNLRCFLQRSVESRTCLSKEEARR